ncbi:MAG: PAS domain S-box protein [Chthoniobacteraceae bacterium]
MNHRADGILAARIRAIYERTDHLFATLLSLQWVVCALLAFSFSALIWRPEPEMVRINQWLSVLGGGLVVAWPVYAASRLRGWVVTRHSIAIGQMLLSALLMHLAGGRPEAYFHAIGSLGLLAFYRDWRVIVSATGVAVAALFAGSLWYGHALPGLVGLNPGLVLEHASWLIFEAIFLLIFIRQSLEAIHDSAGKQAELESVNARTEQRIAERTEELEQEIRLRRRVEEALSQESNLLKTLLESSPDQIYFKDADSRFIKCSHEQARRFRLSSPDEVVGKTDFDYFADEHAHAARLDEQEILRTGQPVIGKIEREVSRKSGEVTWAQSSKMPMRDSEGRVVGTFGISRDITVQMVAADRIREQAMLIENARDAIIVSDMEGRILSWNRGAEEVYGWGSNDVLGHRIVDLLHAGEEPEEVVEAKQVLFETGSWNGELAVKKHDGSAVYLECHWTLLRDEAGRPKSILSINTDITRKKQLEEQFLRAQRMDCLGSLAGGIAHDLNNLLAPILLGMDVLKEQSSLSPPEDILQIMETSAQRAADIVRQVLLFAKGVRPNRVEVRLDALLNEMDRILCETFPKSIRVQTVLSDEMPVIKADPTQIHQVILNLCVNARDAMVHGGSLSIDVEALNASEVLAAAVPGLEPGPHICLTVSDTGMGIPPEMLDRIFEPFFTTKEVGQGTGLGLSTVFGIVKSHGGAVTVRSKVGFGTTFRVYLPSSMPTTAKAWPQVSPALQISGKGQLVLVVDDEPSLLLVTSRSLEHAGFRVLSARDGAEAIRIVTRHGNEIELMLTDMMMPGMEGPSLIREIKKVAPHLVIVGASGGGSRQYESDALAAGAVCFLHKPYSTAKLLQTFHEVLHGHNAAGAA